METERCANGRSSLADTAKQFQAYLREYEKDAKLTILEAVQEPGSKLGDNYMSVMIRTKVVGKRGDGSRYAKSFMVKTHSKTRLICGMLELSILFSNEIHMYRNVLPIYGPFGPRCLHTDIENIIMEDLTEKGYSTCERRDFLDQEHTVFTLKTLAKFHAAGFALKFKDPSLFNELAAPLKEAVYNDVSTDRMGPCAEMSTTMLLQYLKMVEPQTKELEDAIVHFESYNGKAFDTLKKMLEVPKAKYYTICHGDTWTNNLLFLHDQTGKVIDLKMVDYQIARHISVATDFHYLVYTSVRSSLIEKSYESLVKIYHNALLEELYRLNVNEETLVQLDRKWLETELQVNSFYGALLGCWIVHPILAEEEEIQTFEEFDPTKIEEFDFKKLPMSKAKIDRIKCIVLHYHKRYVSGIINDDLDPILDSKVNHK